MARGREQGFVGFIESVGFIGLENSDAQGRTNPMSRVQEKTRKGDRLAGMRVHFVMPDFISLPRT